MLAISQSVGEQSAGRPGLGEEASQPILPNLRLQVAVPRLYSISRSKQNNLHLITHRLPFQTPSLVVESNIRSESPV